MPNSKQVSKPAHKYWPNQFPGSLLPYWFWFIYRLRDNRILSSKVHRDLRIFRKNIFLLLLWPVTILGLPKQQTRKTGLTTEQSQKQEEDFVSHELGDVKSVVYNTAQVLYHTAFGFVSSVVASVPVICSLYWLVDQKLSKDLVIPSSLKQNSYSDEKWFFINGICTNKSGTIVNRDRLESLFKRPITALHNPTEGMFNDVIECIFGRTLRLWTNITMTTFSQISHALRDEAIKKVVLVGHSQGAIIISDVLFMVNEKGKFTDSQLKKLEVYTFGSPADEMKDGDGIIYAEHFVNEYDIVPHFGIIDSSINYQTNRVFFNHQRRGHLLNQHYLFEFALKPYSSKSGLTPRLYSYLS